MSAKLERAEMLWEEPRMDKERGPRVGLAACEGHRALCLPARW